MKKLICVILLLLSYQSYAQDGIQYGLGIGSGYYEDPGDINFMVITDSTPIYGTLAKFKRNVYFEFQTKNIIFDSAFASAMAPKNISWLDSNHVLQFSNISSLNLPQSQITYTGTTSQYIRGNGSYATLPAIPTNTNQLTNGSGYITGITGSQVNSALGYTAYNAALNANNFLTGITSSQIATALGFTPYSAANPNSYISSITGTMVNNALGYTPYNGSTNSLNFLTGINSGQVTTALGFTPYNSTNPSGFISGITSSLVNSALGYTAYNGSSNPLNFLTSINSSAVTTALGYTPYNGTTNTNNYIGTSGARSALSLTATRTSGTPTYTSSTGVLDVPIIKRQESYKGTTDASGNYTITFSVSYSSTPHIQANPIGGTTEIFLKIVSVSTTGFVVNVFQRVSVLSLALSTATTPVSGATVDVFITE